MGLLDYVVKQNSSEVGKFNDYDHPDSELEKFREEFSIFLRNEIGLKHPLTVENVDILKVYKEPLYLEGIDIVDYTSNTIEKEYIRNLISNNCGFDWIDDIIHEDLLDNYGFDYLDDLYGYCLCDETHLNEVVDYLQDSYYLEGILSKNYTKFQDYKIYY